MNRHEPRNPDLTGSYTVAWICALEQEYFCACRMLDEEFSGPDVGADNDDNTYVYGRIAKHYVVIGCLPAGRYGTNSGARVARDMVRTFPHLRFALMVGIGGGAPTARNDIRLGDVVVSQPRDGFGGVIQYDLGKKLPDGRFQRTGQLNAPPEKLLGVIPEIRRLYNDKKKPDRLAEHIQRLHDMEDYQQPAVDRLYAADYLHADGQNCDQCDSHSVVFRPERRNHRILHVHYGTIASGNSVLKDAVARDAYAKDPELNVLCFEMEAAGLMNNVPCLIIRGICDYCDSHKNDDWHKYAALTAAAYARELLLVLRPQRVDAMAPWAERVVQELQQVSQELTSFNNTQRTIQAKVESLDQKFDWAKLPAVEEAAFDSYMNQHEDECLPGTRTELLRAIAEWARSTPGKSMFWLKGMAGTGKSTISRTVAKSFNQADSLGASFFFKGGEGDRGNAIKLFPTITRQLLRIFPGLLASVSNAIHDDPDIATKALKDQFEKLILEPLQELELGHPQTSAAVIVIDALDECEDDNDIRVILQLLPRLGELKAVRLRIFLTSRPDLPMSRGFSKISTKDYQDLVLHEIPEALTKRDISLFLNHRLSQIRKERLLPVDWPRGTDVQMLVTLSVPLFIFAATVCRVFDDDNWDPVDSLTQILTHRSEHSKLAPTYLPVLRRFLNNETDKQRKQLIQEFREVVGAIVILEFPLSIISLSRLIGLPEKLIILRLNPLHSVLRVPKDESTPVRLFHLSFRDFLLHEKTEFWIDEGDMHHRLATRCFLMCDNLRRNICSLLSHGALRAEIDHRTIDKAICPELPYSCRYWAHHLVRSKDINSVLHNAISFLQKHFLHWVEVMSILGLVSEILGIIDRLQLEMPGNESYGMSDFLLDAKRFILKNRQMVDNAPLQIYNSGLVFAPRTAKIRREFEKELPSGIWRLPEVEEAWSAELQTLESHSGRVSSVAFSPNGRFLASGSDDNTVKLWDTASSALHQTLEGHSGWVRSVAFSLDGRFLASGGGDNTVKLWDTSSGALHQTLSGHSGWVTSVAFSPDSQLLASGSDDNTVKLWDTSSGALHQTLSSHSGWVTSVAFSPDSQLLASGSDDNTVKLWDTASGALHQTLEDDIDLATSVAFSPDGRLLAFSSVDGKVKVWDTITGSMRQTLKGHLGWVRSVAFSSDGRLLASGSDDRTVKLWDIDTYALYQTLNGHSDPVMSVAFSPDGRLLASASVDNTVKLWATATPGPEKNLEAHSDRVRSVAFSPDGQLLASGSDDSTVKLWDTASGSLQQTLKGHSGWVRSVAFSPDGRLLASGSVDRKVKLWDTAAGSLHQTLDGHSDRVWSVAFSPDSQLLASGSDDKTVKLWDTASGSLYQTLENHTGWVMSVAFSPDGRLLASGSDDSTVKLWDMASGSLHQTLEGHSGWVRSVAFSPDSRLLVSSSVDNTVKLWDTAKGELHQTLNGYPCPVGSVVFFRDGSCVNATLRSLHNPPMCGKTTSSPPRANVEISILENRWVILNGEKVLWLPPDYRPTCSAIKDSILALGHASGRISFIGFCT